MSLTAFQRVRRLKMVEAMKPENIETEIPVKSMEETMEQINDEVQPIADAIVQEIVDEAETVEPIEENVEPIAENIQPIESNVAPIESNEEESQSLRRSRRNKNA